MTLHEAIEKLLRQHRRPMTTTEIASELNKNKWYQKKDGSPIEPFQIHGRTRNYHQLFERNGSTVLLVDKSLKLPKADQNTPKSRPETTFSKKNSDEKYVIDLCDEVLQLKASRQHKFDFLQGDIGKNGKSRKLPVDSYYDELDLVVEYRERQHTESVIHFDKPYKMTISGVNRGEQRKIYDHRRREVLPKNRIQLIEISYDDFNYDRQKRIIRDRSNDLEVVKLKLKKIKNGS